MSRKSIIALRSSAPLIAMPPKPKAPAAPKPRPSRPPATTLRAPRPQADSRWQRTVRYGWDKGGARGGRK